MRTLEQLLKLTSDHDLSQEEKDLKYGINPVRTMGYKLVDVAGRRRLIWKEFPGNSIPADWADGPAALGIETEPQRVDADSGDMPGLDIGPAAALE